MNAKERAKFINSVEDDKKVSCPKCEKQNAANAKFCTACGTPLEEKAEENKVPFAPVKKVSDEEKKEERKERIEFYEEPESAFADGLPDWNVEPPQIMVRRKRRK